MRIKEILFVILFVIGCASPPETVVDLKAFNPKSLKGWIMIKKVVHPNEDSKEVRFFINKDLGSVFNLAMIETEEGKIISYHYNERKLLHSYSLNVKTNELEAVLLKQETLKSIKMWMRQAEVSYYVSEQAVRVEKGENRLDYKTSFQEGGERYMPRL
jgi:hypothetical protein